MRRLVVERCGKLLDCMGAHASYYIDSALNLVVIPCVKHKNPGQTWPTQTNGFVCTRNSCKLMCFGFQGTHVVVKREHAKGGDSDS